MCFSLILSPFSAAYAQQKSMAGYMDMVLGMGTAVAGTGVLMDCPAAYKSPSVMLFFAGNIAYVAKEILGGKAQTAYLKAKSEEVNALVGAGVSGGEVQKKAIESKLQDEKKKLEVANKRKTWMTAISAIYFAAAGAAALEMVWDWIPTPCIYGAGIAVETATGAAVAGAYSLVVGYGSGSLITSLITAITGAILIYHSSVIPSFADAKTRIIAFGLLGALATTITIMIGSEIKKMEENVKKLEELLAKFNQETTPDNEVDDDYARPGDIKPLPKNSDLKLLAKPNGIPRHCWSHSNGQTTFSEAGCRKPLKLERPNFSGDFNVPSLNAFGDLANDFGQAVANGDTNGADLRVDGLAAQAGRMKKLRDNLLGQLNDKLKKEGKKPINFDAEVKKKYAEMAKGVNDHLAKNGGQPLASNGSATLGEEIKAPPQTVVVNNSEVPATSLATPMSFSEGNLDNSMPQDPVSETTAFSDSLDNYESNEKDISVRKSDSIFKILSIRYSLNFEKLLKKKKTETKGP